MMKKFTKQRSKLEGATLGMPYPGNNTWTVQNFKQSISTSFIKKSLGYIWK